MSQINVRNLSNENDDGAPDIVGVSTFSATSYFVPPVGNTSQRPSNPQAGDLRFNTDIGALEYFRGDTINWTQIEMTSPDLNGGARGIVGGYSTTGDVIEYITISTLGNSNDFGDLSVGRYNAVQNCCNRNRMIFGGGYDSGGWTNTIDYITVSSTGDATDFGDLTEKRLADSGVNNNTRGIFAGGQHAPDHSGSNVIDYVTIAQTGNAVDFGDLVNEKSTNSSVCSSTRGVISYGTISPSPEGTIDYVTMASTGNASSFGNLDGTAALYAGGSSSTRGLFAGGYITNIIQYITIATTGDSTDFGDLTQARFNGRGLSSPTRDVFVGSRAAPGTAKVNTMDYVEIATTGNAVDFGDLTTLGSQTSYAGNSNAHGGL